jgi:hypothetical protein
MLLTRTLRLCSRPGTLPCHEILPFGALLLVMLTSVPNNSRIEARMRALRPGFRFAPQRGASADMVAETRVPQTIPVVISIGYLIAVNVYH